MTNPPIGAEGRRTLEEAQEAAARGEYEQAAALYQRLIGNPDPTVHVAGLLGLADSRYRLDDEEGALQAWIVATQAPETPLTWQAWVALAGARVRQTDLPGAARAYREAERRAPPDERQAIAARLGWLNKEMGNSFTANRYFSRARAGVFSPIATYAIIGITVVVSLFISYGGRQGDELGSVLALNKQAVMHGEYWRLVTVTLVHAGLIHLLFNMYALYIAGPLAEALYGRALFVAIYLLSAASGSVASFLLFPSPSVGASGAVFGLFGLLFTATLVHKPALTRQARALTRQLGILIVINLVFSFAVSGIDYGAHVGGLLGGAWLGLVVAPRGAATLRSLWQRVPQTSTRFRQRYAGVLSVLGFAVVLLVVLIGLQIKPFWA